MNKLSILLLIVALTATFNAAEARLRRSRRLRRLSHSQCANNFLSVCPMCLRHMPGCHRCTEKYMSRNYMQLKAVGCLGKNSRRLGVWGKALGIIGNDIWNRPVANGECNNARCGSGYYNDVMPDDEYVGGGRVYGEYNKGPVRAGAEYNFDRRRLGAWGKALGIIGNDIWNRPVANGECNNARCGNAYHNDVMPDDEYVGGGRVYGEYNKGPVRAGAEYNFDQDDEDVGSWDQPSHTRPHMPDGQSMGNWINFRL